MLASNVAATSRLTLFGPNRGVPTVGLLLLAGAILPLLVLAGIAGGSQVPNHLLQGRSAMQANLHVDSSARPSTFGGHYWVGADYTGTASTSTYVYTTIGTPSSGPRDGDLYYELLSAFDSNGNYDQIGLASAYCSSDACAWCPTYCTTNDYFTVIVSEGTPSGQSGCHLAYNFNNVIHALGIYEDFTFEMKLSGTFLQFLVYSGTGVAGTLQWSDTTGFSDSAAHFVISQQTTVCQGTNEENFQPYEEVYNVTNSMSFPQWNSGMAFTYYGTTEATTWATWSANSPPTSPHGYYSDITDSGQFVRIDNEAMWVSFPTDLASIAPGGSYTWTGTLNADGGYCSPCTSTQWTWSVSWPTSQGNGGGSIASPYDIPNSAITYDFNPFSTATPGLYYGQWTATLTSTTPHEYTTFIFYITIT